VFLPGADDLRFGQQFEDYVSGSNKPQILDLFGQMTTGSNLDQLGDKAVGVVGEYSYVTSLDNPVNKTMIQQWQAKYPGRPLSADVAIGYSGAQVLEAALKAVNGQIEQKDQFLQALYKTNLDTPRGHISLDSDHDIVQTITVYQIEKDSNGLTSKILASYPNVATTWDRSAQQIQNFAYGKLKGTWEGKTKADLGDVLTLPAS
jgi:branched-chain amino acid transport system substrate-binding protein